MAKKIYKIIHVASIESHTNKNTKYTVSLRANGVWECGCPHWVHRHADNPGMECKHIRDAQQDYIPPEEEEMSEPELNEEDAFNQLITTIETLTKTPEAMKAFIFDMARNHPDFLIEYQEKSRPVTRVETEILDALNRGKKIEAIKILRGELGIGLKDAKEQIDNYLEAKQYDANIEYVVGKTTYSLTPPF